jgi:hypothetical protein
MKRWLIIIVIVLGVLMILPYLIVIFSFGGSGISKNINDWGVYATFVSGFLSPIFQVANVLALVYVTIVVNNWNTKRSDYELKYNAYKEFSDIFNEFAAIIINESRDVDKANKLDILSYKFYSVFSLNSHLFKLLSDNSKLDLIQKKFTELCEHYRSYTSNFEAIQSSRGNFFTTYVFFLKSLREELNEK